MNHIYCFYDKEGNLLYVGKTTNLPNRMSGHFSTAIMEKEPWKELVDLNNIKLYRCSSRTDLDIYETYFINKLKPLYNKDKVFYDLPSFELPTLKSTVFIYSSYKRTNTELGKNFEEGIIRLKQIFTSQEKEDLEIIEKILEKYSWLKSLIANIGYEESFKLIEQEKYRLTNIRRKVINFQDSSVDRKVVELLLSYPDIVMGEFISAVKAKEILKEVYLKLNIGRTAKGSDLNSYFVTKAITKSVKNKMMKGYIPLVKI